MPYVALDDTDIEASKPTKEEIFSLIKSNQESFNTDIESLKQTSIIDIYNMSFSGEISQYSLAEIATAVPVFRAPVAATMVAFKAVLLETSTSGSVTIDLDKSTDEGVNWTSLLTTPVTITGTAIGSISGTVDWVDVPSQSFAQGELLRLRVSGIQVNQGRFHVNIYGELS